MTVSVDGMRMTQAQAVRFLARACEQRIRLSIRAWDDAAPEDRARWRREIDEMMALLTKIKLGLGS